MEQPAAAEYEIYIVAPEDTLAGIALSRSTSIAEIKLTNKLWGNTIFPGQKLKVRKKRDRASPDGTSPRHGPAAQGAAPAKHAGKRESASAGSAGGGGGGGGGGGVLPGAPAMASSQPLLVRLRDLFDQRDALYAHHVVPRAVLPTRVSNLARMHLKAAPRLTSSDDSRVITIAAVLLRLHPFLAVNGQMTLTSTRLIFLPNLQDPHVRKLGATLLQVDVPIANITAAKRVQAAELDALVTEDVGLRLQEEQRFLDVVFRTDTGNIVVAPRAMKRRPEARRKHASEEDSLQSLHFMLSPESLSVVRSKLMHHLEQSAAATADGIPTLVGADPAACIPTRRDLLELAPHIPAMFQGVHPWYLRFATQVDGVSRTTLGAKLGDVAPLLLFVKTRMGQTFGAFIGDELKYGREHYGSDRTFVFRLNPFNVWFAAERGGYFLLVNEKGISIGTDATGAVTLFIDDELAAGETHRSAVFNNDPLIDDGFRFEIAALEFYAFEPPS